MTDHAQTAADAPQRQRLYARAAHSEAHFERLRPASPGFREEARFQYIPFSGDKHDRALKQVIDNPNARLMTAEFDGLCYGGRITTSTIFHGCAYTACCGCCAAAERTRVRAAGSDADIEPMRPVSLEFHEEARFRCIPFSREKHDRALKRVIDTPETKLPLIAKRFSGFVGYAICSIGEYLVGIEDLLTVQCGSLFRRTPAGQRPEQTKVKRDIVNCHRKTKSLSATQRNRNSQF